MYLNWTLEVVADFCIGFSLLIGALYSFKKEERKQIKTLFYLRFVWFNLSSFFFIEGLSCLFLNMILTRISAILLFPAALFLIIAINYNLKDTFNSISLIFTCSFGAILIYLAIQPNNTKIIFEEGYYTVIWIGLFKIIGNLFVFIFASYIVYWAFKAWLNAPFEIKKEALIFLMGTIFASIVSNLIFILSLWRHSFIILANLSGAVGFSICGIIIRKEPKILYILPFIPYKIYIYDVEGKELFSYTWTKSDVNETLLSKFSTIIMQSNNDTLNIGSIIDIKFEYSILILRKLSSLIVILEVSKSSKILRSLIKKFAKEFEIKFEKEINNKLNNKSSFESAKILIKKYFSIFPSRMIRNEKQQLLFSKKYVKIPVELENKLKEIIKDENELESLKCEIQRSPEKAPEEFLTLLNELEEFKEEIKNKNKKKF